MVKMTERKYWFVRVHLILLFTVGLSLFSVRKAEATHLRAGQITVERVGCSSRQVKVTVTVYTDTDCTSCVLFGGDQDVLDFGDGTSVLVPETQNTPFPGGVNIGTASRTFFHTYPGIGRYTISYIEPNRNEGVLNIANSVYTTFYIETEIDLTVGCARSPVLLVPPIDEACSGVTFFHNPGAYDPDGDSLSYELVVPFLDRNAPVVNYRDPNNAEFYAGLDYNNANEAGDGPPTFSMDPVDGTLKWDAPGQVGEYNVAFVVNEWRKINGVWTKIGFVRRDMQIIVVADCTNERPELIIPADTCVVAGTTIHEMIFGTDDTPNPNLPDHHPVKIEAFSEILATSFTSRATVQPTPAVFQPSNPPAELEFNWNTVCEHVKDQSYQVVFKITDDPPLGPSLVSFETWRIKVVGPAPVLQQATAIGQQANLQWDLYDCQNAVAMQIWRRVDSATFTPDNCQTGMPESLGYSLIATVPINTTTYLDTNGGNRLAVGATYCYRLVAVFPLPMGGESYVSNEACTEPIKAIAPVITHVTVDKTGITDGEVTVRWTPPFEIDPVQYPGPYEYILKRIDGTGFKSPRIDETTTFFVDTGLNTRERQYFYQVLLYSPAFPKAVDSSSVASSVWLDLNPQKSKIELNWSAAVPWSIQLQDFPLHDVYRGPEGSIESDLTFIESVNVIQDGLIYLDEGTLAEGDSLDGSKIYCYRVVTLGGYGNPAITEPLVNYSQINCAQPTDDVDPCPPILTEFDVCEEETGCDANTFTNTIRWSVPDGACQDDIRSYNLYVVGSDIPYKTNIRDNFYIDADLASLARCYQVTSVDRSGNESEKSNEECNDNCPHYELPNVFSPGNADGKNCNELLSAFGVPLGLGENPPCPESDPTGEKCARFIQKVDFTVYNRWGGKVYHYVGQQGDENNGIYIKWDGRDEKGRELATAVYFYVAKVTRDVIDPDNKVKVIKGWVHLVR